MSPRNDIYEIEKGSGGAIISNIKLRAITIPLYFSRISFWNWRTDAVLILLIIAGNRNTSVTFFDSMWLRGWHTSSSMSLSDQYKRWWTLPQKYWHSCKESLWIIQYRLNITTETVSVKILKLTECTKIWHYIDIPKLTLWEYWH